MNPSFVGKDQRLVRAAGTLTLLLLLVSCGDRGKAVSGTIEVDEAHVGPRAGGRVEKIFAWEGDHLHEDQAIVQLDASELRARRDLAAAQIDTAIHDADAQEAQLQFLRDDARRQQDLLKRKVVSPNDAERADSAAKSQEKNLAAAKMRVAQARAQLADIDAQLAEMQVTAPADSILEVLSVKVGDVLPANREAATLLLTGHLWVRVYVPESSGFDQTRRARPRPGRFVSWQRFRWSRRADKSPGRVYPAQRANSRGPDQTGVWGEGPFAERRRPFARRNGCRCLLSKCEMMVNHEEHEGHEGQNKI